VQRLKTRAQFQTVMQAGGIVSRSAHFALHRCAAQHLAPVPRREADGPEAADQRDAAAPATVWIGALLPKRWARRAVTRNALRRQIYSVAAEFEPRLAQAAHLVRLRAGFDRARFVSASSEALRRAVRGELQQLFAGAAGPAAAPAAAGSAS
jgi:ribonuclease P protein component